MVFFEQRKNKGYKKKVLNSLWGRGIIENDEGKGPCPDCVN